MDFSIETRTVPAGGDFRWLGSSHGVDTAQPGTLDITALAGLITAAGILQSGVAVGKITASGLYGPFTAGATNGTEVLAGFVLADINTRTSLNVALPSGKAAFALLKQGTIKRSRLPIVAQRTAITHTTVSTGQFVYAD